MMGVEVGEGSSSGVIAVIMMLVFAYAFGKFVFDLVKRTYLRSMLTKAERAALDAIAGGQRPIARDFDAAAVRELFAKGFVDTEWGWALDDASRLVVTKKGKARL